MKVRILRHIKGWPQPGRVIDIIEPIAAAHIAAGNIEAVDVKKKKKRKKKK